MQHDLLDFHPPPLEGLELLGARCKINHDQIYFQHKFTLKSKRNAPSYKFPQFTFKRKSKVCKKTAIKQDLLDSHPTFKSWSLSQKVGKKCSKVDPKMR